MKRIIPIALILALVLTLGAIPAMAAPVYRQSRLRLFRTRIPNWIQAIQQAATY